jgi:hypothetical protein
VDVDIANIPIGVYFVAIVAESETAEIHALNYWPPSEGGPVTMPPERYIGSFRDPNGTSVGRLASWLEWRNARRYGVITRSKDGTWRITWFAASQIPIEGRHFILGGGRVRIDLSQGMSEVLPQEAIRELGFERVERRKPE